MERLYNDFLKAKDTLRRNWEIIYPFYGYHDGAIKKLLLRADIN